MSRLEIESRHSDWGEDAGGYSVLRFDGEWVGRVEDRAAARKLLEYVEELEGFNNAALKECSVEQVHAITTKVLQARKP